MTTQHGELTVRATTLRLTSKSLRPLPDKHKGLTDPEARMRMRYVDLIVRPEARDIAYKRATVVRSVRDSLHARGFTEVETPILQPIHGGANARPFETHINAYDMDLYLRIATELHLKRLLVGGIEKVFELGRQFRNEGVDFKHNPEFTSLEVYETYGDYNTMRVLTQELIQEAATAVYGAPVVAPYRRRRHAPSSTTSPATGRSRRSARRCRRRWARRSRPTPPSPCSCGTRRRSGWTSTPSRRGASCSRRSTASCARARRRPRSSTPTSRRRTRR